jgi:hypothetical protein
MHAIDRRLIQLWLAVTAGAGCAMFFTSLLVLLFLTIIGIPLALLLTYLPGAWIYLTAALPIYALLRLVWRETAPVLFLVIALIPPLAAGFAIPLLANRATTARIGTLMAEDHGAPPALPPGLSITHASDMLAETTTQCEGTCQRLLFSRTASSFVQVPLDEVKSLASLPAPARRFSIGPLGKTCNNERLRASYASPEEVGDMRPPPFLWDKLPEFARQGLCVHDAPVRDARADVVVAERWNYDPSYSGFRFYGAGQRLSLHPIEPFKRREVFRRTAQGWTRLMRRTEVRYAHLAMPLWLVPGFSFDTATPTHWAWDNQRTAGDPIKVYQSTKWNGIIANDLAVRGLR